MNDPLIPSNRENLIALSAIERVTKPKFFFLFGSFLFALDCGINFLTGKSLYSLDPGIAVATIDWGKLFVFLLSFSFLMAFAMKVMRYIVEELIQHPVSFFSARWGMFWGAERKCRSDSERSAWDAVRIAQDRNDRLLYEIAKSTVDLNLSRLKERIETAQMAFSTLIFMMLNRFVFGDITSPTILLQFAIWSESGVGYAVIVYMFWGAVIFSWLFEAFLSETHFDGVYVPDSKSKTE